MVQQSCIMARVCAPCIKFTENFECTSILWESFYLAFQTCPVCFWLQIAELGGFGNELTFKYTRKTAAS